MSENSRILTNPFRTHGFAASGKEGNSIGEDESKLDLIVMNDGMVVVEDDVGNGTNSSVNVNQHQWIKRF